MFHEGDAGTQLHLIDSGRVAVRVTTPLGDVATLTILGAGDVLGEGALIGAGERSATAVALEKTETIAVGRAEFDDLRVRHPTVERFLTAVLAAQVRRLSAQLIEALYVPAERRVLRRLVEVCHVYGVADGEVVVPLTQEHLASLAGTTRPTANRVLRDAQDAGLVTLARGAVTVMDVARLRDRSR